MKKRTGLIPLEIVERRIYLIRGQKVILDSDLAELYGVPTKVLNQAVKRNRSRFPADFMFRIDKKEAKKLISQFTISNEGLNRSQIVTGSQKHRDPSFAPYAFTEQGVAMLSSVLRSERAVLVNIAIMRVFVRLRRMLADHAELLNRLDALEREQQELGGKVETVFKVIRKLLEPPLQPPEPPPEEEKPPIGFRPPVK